MKQNIISSLLYTSLKNLKEKTVKIMTDIRTLPEDFNICTIFQVFEALKGAYEKRGTVLEIVFFDVKCSVTSGKWCLLKI